MLHHYQPPPPAALDLVYRDTALLVINKPSGLLSVPGRGEDKQDSMATRVQAEFPEALIVHRLDMETSGLLVMARGKTAQSRLATLFQERRIHKRYVAVVAGQLPADHGEIDLPLLSDWPNRPRQMVDFLRGKPSRTRYQLLAWNEPEQTSRVTLFPITGRSHQLRVHLQALGHPILGDSLYGSESSRKLAPRLLLHAQALHFPHPVTSESICLENEVPF